MGGVKFEKAVFDKLKNENGLKSLQTLYDEIVKFNNELAPFDKFKSSKETGLSCPLPRKQNTLCKAKKGGTGDLTPLIKNWYTEYETASWNTNYALNSKLMTSFL